MTYDADSFNKMIERTLRNRMFRLLRDAGREVLEGPTISFYESTFRDLFGVVVSPLETANPLHLSTVTLVGIHDRLVDIARGHRLLGDQRGDIQQFAALETELDDEENGWRAAINLLPVTSAGLP